MEEEKRKTTDKYHREDKHAEGFCVCDTAQFFSSMVFTNLKNIIYFI